MIKVSIIIPVYNVAQYIENCLLSVFQQTYKNIEIILINDCGKDNSMDIVHSLVCNYSNKNNLKIISHPYNKGLSEARNTGIKHATGEYIYFLDSDDTIVSDCIESLVRPLNKEKIDFVIGDFKTINSNNKFFHHYLDEKTYYKTNDEILSNLANSNWYMMACNKLVNRKFLIENKLFFKEGILHEDLLWSIKLGCCASTMYAIKKKTYLYLIREGSITQKLSVKNFNSYNYIIEDCYLYVQEKKLQNDKNVHNILESLKYLFLENMYKNVSLIELKQSYKKYREQTATLTNSRKLFLNKKLKEIIRDFHLILPLKIGFYYILTLISIKKLIKRK